MVSQTKRIIRVYLMLLVLLSVMSFFSLAVGSVRVSAADLLAVLEGKTENDMIRHILFDIRLPRMLAALILGGALSVSGFLLQTFFSNPIAGPFVLGISSGAKLVVSVFMILFLGQGLIMNSWGMVLAAFLGAMASMGFVLAISKKLPQMSMLVVSGIMIGYICSAATDFIVTFADDSNIVNLHNWSMGSFFRDLHGRGKDLRFCGCGSFPFFHAALESHGGLSAGGSIREKYGSQYQTVPDRTDPPVQYSFRHGDSLCGPSFFRWYRGAPCDQAAL